jgi:hypothetical protein
VTSAGTPATTARIRLPSQSAVTLLPATGRSGGIAMAYCEQTFGGNVVYIGPLIAY